MSVKSKAVLERDIGFAFFIQANLDCFPFIAFWESCVLVTQSQCRGGIKRNKLETIAFNFVTNLYARCEKLPRKAHVAFNSNSSGTYNGAVNRRIVGISKCNVVIDKDKQVAFVFAAARRRGLATAGKAFSFVLDKDFGVDS